MKFTPKRSRLIVVCGLQGTGKSVVSRRIAERTGSVLLRTDVVRKELYETPHYNEAEIEQVYHELLARAGGFLDQGKSVVLDGTFARREQRDRAEQIARDRGGDVTFLEVTCPPEIVRERLDNRVGDASDATYAVYLAAQKRFDPLSGPHIVIDNAGGMPEIESQLDVCF